MRPIAASSPPPPPQRTAWHSPVPYLFGGLAAMLGLIAFALLILACSYWKLSVQSEERERRERDLEAHNHDKNKSSGEDEEAEVYEEKILVIMAGDRRPTFLATPVSAKVAGFRDCDVAGFKVPKAETGAGEVSGKVKEMSRHENEEEEEEA